MRGLLIGMLVALGTAQAQTSRIPLEEVVKNQRRLLHDWGGLIRHGSAVNIASLFWPHWNET